MEEKTLTMAGQQFSGAPVQTEGYNVGILTVSDSCFNNPKHDVSGKNMYELFSQGDIFPANEILKKIVADEKQKIEEILVIWADHCHLDLILTIGGTGFSPRDITPEATEAVVHRKASSLAQAAITLCAKNTRFALLSRATSGIRGSTLILNLPGSVSGSFDCFMNVVSILPHAIDQLRGDYSAVKRCHAIIQGVPDVPKCKSKVDTTKVALRPRKSTFDLVSREEALDIILRACEACVVPIELKKYNESVGYVSAYDVRAAYPSPPFKSSIKDGYAVFAAEGKGLRKVLGALTAGMCARTCELQPGGCMRVNTGGPVPLNADAIVQVEDTFVSKKSDQGDCEIEILVIEEPVHGADMREVGSDFHIGQVIIPKGRCITAVDCGTLCAAGIEEIAVRCYPRVALLSTGDELVEVGETLRPGSIFDSNKPVLLAMLKEMKVCCFDAGIAKDDPNDIQCKVEVALQKSEVIIITGGVSMGEKDYIKDVLELDFSAQLHFGRIYMKPGKPTTFATVLFQGKTKLIFCLPGNPVSATVTFHLFVIPCLRKIIGHKEVTQLMIKAQLAEDVILDVRPEYHRVSVMWNKESCPVAQSTGNQLSSRLLSLHEANGLMMLPPRTSQQDKLLKGSSVDVMMLNIFLPHGEPVSC